MTEAQKHDNLLKHVTNLCQILNANGIKARFWDHESEGYKYYDWRVDENSPESTFLGGICGNKEAFHFLKNRGEIDKHICWDCGEQPIKNQYTFSDGYDASINYFICSTCHTSGQQLQKAFRGNSPSKCFVATVCYHDENALEVRILRRFRDTSLIKNFFGFHFTRLYYLISPSFSRWLSQKPFLVKLIRKFILDKFVKKLMKKYNQY